MTIKGCWLKISKEYLINMDMNQILCPRKLTPIRLAAFVEASWFIYLVIDSSNKL